MKFGDLSVGAKFRFYPRGPVRTKATHGNYDADGQQFGSGADADVIPVEQPASVPDAMLPDPTHPWGPEGPRVVISSSQEATLEGVFSPWQLASVIDLMKRAKKV